MSHRWQNTIVDPSSTIKDALEVIDREALRLVLVVDKNDCLLGVVSDGDIRRGLLKNLSLSTEITQVMNSTPITAEASTSREELKAIMTRKDILSIPILDNQKVVDLVTINGLHNNSHSYENPVFLMAGGFGTRLRPLTDSCPKPMLKIGDKPILETVIRSFIKAGFVNFFISTHYLPEKIEQHFGDGSDFGVKITYVHEDTPLGTGGALGLLAGVLPNDLPLIMMNGDVLTTIDFERLLEFHIKNSADATICVREYDYKIPYGVITGQGSKIKSMVEKPVQRFFVNAGIYVISQRVVNSVGTNCCIDMPTLLEQHMHERDNLLMFPIYEYWLDIGRIDDFNRAQDDFKKLNMD